MGKEEEGCGGKGGTQDRRDPARPEHALGQAAGPVEGLAKRQQHQRPEAQKGGIPDGEIVHERGDRTGQKGRHREPPRRGDTPGQPMRHDQQHDPGNRRGEGAPLKQQRADDIALGHGVRTDRGDHGHQKQPDTEAKRDDGDQQRRQPVQRRQRRLDLGIAGQKLLSCPAGKARLVQGHQQEGQHEGQDIVDQPEQQQRRGHVPDRHRCGHGTDDDGLEHADAAGDMAQDADHARGGIDGDENGEIRLSRRQQDP